MFKNYFMLNRFIVEANEILSGARITNIFSGEKNKLVFSLNREDQYLFLEVSVNPGFPFINLSHSSSNDAHSRKNRASFFSEHLPSIFKSIEIAEDDRIIKIKLESCSLYFAIRGKYTNVYLINDNLGVDSFKKCSEDIKEEFVKEIQNKEFIQAFNIPDFSGIVNLTEFKQKYPFIGKEIIAETDFRNEKKTVSEFKEILQKILIEILIEKPAVFISREENQISVAVTTFHIFPYSGKKIFDNLIDAFNFYFRESFYLEEISEKKKVIQKYLERELGKVSSKINSSKSAAERESREEEYNRIGNLLLININSIKKGMKEIEVDDIYNNNMPEIIKLNSSLLPRQNADYYFKKSKSEKIGFSKSREIYKSAKNKFDLLKRIEKRFLQTENLKEYNLIMKELNLTTEKTKSTQEDIKNKPALMAGKFRHYLVDGKFNIYVGKDSQTNDLLTTKFAKQNDYWFHARGVSGSHLVLKIENAKEPVPKNILKKAASLAAYHSKAKTAGLVPVSYTQKKYVIKKKGMEPGKVALLKEDVLLVEPGIPKGCEYIKVE
jgi:predicted ribosome quality control (RQC) complex YloA/Tae2 family protein